MLQAAFRQLRARDEAIFAAVRQLRTSQNCECLLDHSTLRSDLLNHAYTRCDAQLLGEMRPWSKAATECWADELQRVWTHFPRPLARLVMSYVARPGLADLPPAFAQLFQQNEELRFELGSAVSVVLRRDGSCRRTFSDDVWEGWFEIVEPKLAQAELNRRFAGRLRFTALHSVRLDLLPVQSDRAPLDSPRSELFGFHPSAPYHPGPRRLKKRACLVGSSPGVQDERFFMPCEFWLMPSSAPPARDFRLRPPLTLPINSGDLLPALRRERVQQHLQQKAAEAANAAVDIDEKLELAALEARAVLRLEQLAGGRSDNKHAPRFAVTWQKPAPTESKSTAALGIAGAEEDDVHDTASDFGGYSYFSYDSSFDDFYFGHVFDADREDDLPFPMRASATKFARRVRARRVAEQHRRLRKEREKRRDRAQLAPTKPRCHRISGALKFAS